MKKNSSEIFSDLISIVDDGIMDTNVSHIFRGNKDICLEYFNEQDEECIKHNASRQPLNP